MNISNAKYMTGADNTIIAIIDGREMFVPTDPNNTEYAEILKQVQAGTLTIADADPFPTE